MSGRRFFIETYGCQMNKAESEAMLIDLVGDGWEPGESEEGADLVIINTCSVRETAEERIRGRLGHYRHVKKGRPFTLALVGCMAERLGERISADFPEVDVVAGTFRKRELADAVRRPRRGGGPTVLTGGGEYEFAAMHSAAGMGAFLPIMHGCDNFCSYCIVPFVRGREVSRSPQEVLRELGSLEERGVREVTLLGQNVNSYRFSDESGVTDFPALLTLIAGRVRSIRRVRFLTSHPKDLSDATIRVLAAHRVFCRHIHLPVQSGSDSVLERMNRGYTARGYLALVDRIRASLTGASLSTDILIGFPGETEADVQDTLRLMERAGFEDAFTYYFNPREGTPACSMADQLPGGVKLARLAAVIETQRAIAARRLTERLGSEVEVLVEGVSRKSERELLSRTEWDGMVVFPGSPSLVGSFARVRLTCLSGNTFRGQPL
jgi:tRNA-2-methylthio-N6-dimethylallyladenosine synthase